MLEDSKVASETAVVKSLLRKILQPIQKIYISLGIQDEFGALLRTEAYRVEAAQFKAFASTIIRQSDLTS